MSAANPIATLQRQRVPFLPLLVLAICGIFLAEHMSVPSTFWLIGTLAAAAVFFAGHRRMAFGAFALCAFATLHLWRSDESQPATFADRLGFGSVAAEVRSTVASEPCVLSPEYSSVEVRVSQLQLQGYELAPSFVTRVHWPGTPPGRRRSSAARRAVEDRTAAKSGAVQFCGVVGTPAHFHALTSHASE